MKKEIKVSVRNLVEFVLRSGDLDTSFMGSSRAVEGTRAHTKIQNSYGDEYNKEVTLKQSFQYEDFNITVEGRADGIFKENEKTVIDEIKTTTTALDSIDEDYNEMHWAQGKCYAYIYGKLNHLDDLDVNLTYYHLDTEEMKKFRRSFFIEELESFFYFLIDRYLKWICLTLDWTNTRDDSIRKLNFPYDAYRKGQRELAVATYNTILDEKNLFVQAPTGIGKTISTLFPSIKSLGEGIGYKIFYLTAKTITRQVALDSIENMKSKGLRIKTIVLTAKEKICLNDEVNCDPNCCSYAKGHYDRVNEAIMEILENKDIITRELVEYYAKMYNVCPFELSLDLCIFADCIICDYNYVFDPMVSLKRFFQEEREDFIFLVDEAHNLVDRARDMYSIEIYKKPFLEYKKYFKESERGLSKAFGKINSFMLGTKKWYNDENYFVRKEGIDEIILLIERLMKKLEPWLLENKEDEKYKEILDVYFSLVGFVKIWDIYDEKFITYGEKVDEDIKLKLFCLDPSHLLSETLKKGRSAVFFSATLTPLEYFKEILGGAEEDYTMKIPSPFDEKNLSLSIAEHISTRYKDRGNSYLDIAKYIETVAEGKKGNYFVFFPSYVYMEKVYEIFKERNENINTIIQSSSMEESEKEDFLKEFQDDNKTRVAFAVLGGIFSEGIDLTGDKLIGAIIVGVGLPQICLERNIIRNYFDEKNKLGYEYAYMYPGMNKVLQAAGRVIRTEKDKGVVLLIDDRFTTYKYKKLFPKEWMIYKKARNLENLKRRIEEFWE
ncbi:ATP-dependent DNA helicase [Sporanaerobacter acetigenes]|uniref:ATP-dependent DNA helicase n=1 Tax=Sporanaerobacter acetigenes TaxID=165813 RepID=UPI001044DB51|nr:ATP-dependent DNA helicase [Sporanaerobacter acetigenes]